MDKKEKEKILAKTKEIVDQIVALRKPIEDSGKDKKRRGGYLVIWACNGSDRPLLHESVGEISTGEDIWKYRYFSYEKAARMLLDEKIISSWENRNEDEEIYGGGIYVADCPANWAPASGSVIIAFSGFSEEEDEAICLALALSFMWITSPTYAKIIKISKNPTIDKLKL